MGGSDKGLVSLNGKPLIEHIIEKLSQQTPSLTISANRNVDTYRQYARVISDERSGFQGPLAGIEMSLKSADTDWVGFTPCDSPNLTEDLVSRLTNQLDPDVDIYVASDGKKLQPVFSVWNKKILAALTSYLENGDRKIMLFFESCNTKVIDFSDSPEMFANLNSPEDLKKFGAEND